MRREQNFKLRHLANPADVADVRYGSKADICIAKGHVCFTPESDIKCDTGECPLWAKSGLMHRGKKRLFNQLVGTHLKLMRNREAESLRNLKVDHQLVLRGRLHRQVARFFSLEDAIDICRSFPMRFDGVETSPDAIAMPAFGQTGLPREL